MPLFAGSTAVPCRAVATPFVSSSLLVSSVSLLLCSCIRAFVLVSLLVLPAPPRRAAVSIGAPFLCSCFAVQALLPASPFSVVPSLLCLIFPVLCLSKSPFSLGHMQLKMSDGNLMSIIPTSFYGGKAWLRWLRLVLMMKACWTWMPLSYNLRPTNIPIDPCWDLSQLVAMSLGYTPTREPLLVFFISTTALHALIL
ncbi:hypothetical protein PIB30_054059 [Stylosanthes scabra]|uniref:Uncharacterized protein n=1 Tax=Stylosanthes scabra TaxID=79078 RepID=A0ABU6UJ36_9FABA|nr:hypothetical protein [Stylosanthes scabra]